MPNEFVIISALSEIIKPYVSHSEIPIKESTRKVIDISFVSFSFTILETWATGAIIKIAPAISPINKGSKDIT